MSKELHAEPEEESVTCSAAMSKSRLDTVLVMVSYHSKTRCSIKFVFRSKTFLTLQQSTKIRSIENVVTMKKIVSNDVFFDRNFDFDRKTLDHCFSIERMIDQKDCSMKEILNCFLSICFLDKNLFGSKNVSQSNNLFDRNFVSIEQILSIERIFVLCQ